MTPKLSSEIEIHGFLLWASMGFLMPVGILIMRKSNREECGRRIKVLLYIHGVLQASQNFLSWLQFVLNYHFFPLISGLHDNDISTVSKVIITMLSILQAI